MCPTCRPNRARSRTSRDTARRPRRDRPAGSEVRMHNQLPTRQWSLQARLAWPRRCDGWQCSRRWRPLACEPSRADSRRTGLPTFLVPIPHSWQSITRIGPETDEWPAWTGSCGRDATLRDRASLPSSDRRHPPPPRDIRSIETASRGVFGYSCPRTMGESSARERWNCSETR